MAVFGLFRSDRTLFTGLCVSAACCMSVILLTIFFPRPFDYLNWALFDWKTRAAAPARPSPDLVHLDIDDKAIIEWGQWPWDREKSARIVRRLAELGAKTIVFDILYSAKGKSEEGNRALIEAIRETGTVVSAVGLGSVQWNNEDPIVPADRKRAVAVDSRCWPMDEAARSELIGVKRFKNTMLPLPGISEYSEGLGHIKALPDADGVHRRVPMFIRLYDRVIPSLSLAALCAYWDIDSDNVMFDGSRVIRVRRAGEILKIPVNDRAFMVIDWSSRDDGFKHYSATDLFDTSETEAEKSFKYNDKAVIIALNVSGMTDIGITPIAHETALSRIHSNALSNMLTGNFVRELEAFPSTLVPAVILALVFAVFAPRLRLWLGLTLVFGACAVFVAASFFAFFAQRLDIPAAEFITIVLPAGMAAVIVSARSRESEAARASDALKRYLSPEMLDIILHGDHEIDLTTKRRELTVVFLDIEGFSTFSEEVDVEYINQFLNEFFDRMTQAIFDERGTVDKFLGDGLMAFFGDPVPLEDHADAAVRAARRMQQEMIDLNRKWYWSGIEAFHKGLRIRIGISTGHVIIGNIGSSRRMEYTVVGSIVNIASRLQAKAPPGGILMTARTKALLKDPPACDGPQTIHVKGIDRGLEVFSVSPPPAPEPDQP